MKGWVRTLVDWFRANRREMPWRTDPEPYKVWVSEIMLQQTQVDTVIPYFNRFIARFPTVQTLAAAELEAVLKAWEGLGYYSRARNLHKAAKEVIARFAGKLPRTYNALQTLPGFGPYTAAAVASIAYGEAVPVVDGNVLRVFARFWGIVDDIRSPKTRITLFERLLPFVKKADPSTFNQAIMELGALVCRPKHPQCHSCPLQRDCFAYRKGKTDVLPVVSKRAPVPHYEIAVGVVWKKDKLLVGRRKTDQMLGGLWEFPGGKRKRGESLEQTAARELEEETSLSVKVLHPYCTVKHAYTHFKITLTAFKCAYTKGKERPNTSDELRWITPDELDRYPFPKANKRVIDAIRTYETKEYGELFEQS